MAEITLNKTAFQQVAAGAEKFLLQNKSSEVLIAIYSATQPIITATGFHIQGGSENGIDSRLVSNSDPCWCAVADFNNSDTAKIEVEVFA